MGANGKMTTSFLFLTERRLSLKVVNETKLFAALK